MPPIRTLATAKPMKTERTHEENQERAYIAASRRSDRSLEARIESARRASEIHKKRTGRALRVTEQDVVNEEMYEEEDDDLPAQYRRLTAHLNTHSVDFNRKLQAYLTTHHAGREALGSLMMNSFSQPYPNAPGFAPQMTMIPQLSYPQPQMMPPQMIHRSPSSFRAAPYHVHQSHGAKAHQRSQSFAAPQEYNYQQNPVPNRPVGREDRRMSLPAQPVRSPSASPTATRSGACQADVPRDSAQPSPPAVDAQPTYAATTSSPESVQSDYAFSYPYDMLGPFSMELPQETQQMLGPSMDPNDLNTALFMGNGEMFPQAPVYSYNPNLNGKRSSSLSNPSTQGMHQTLSLGNPPIPAVDPQQLGFNSQMSTESDRIPHNPAIFQPVDWSSYVPNYDFAKPGMSRQNSTQGSSGLVTPGLEWTKFIDGNLLEEQLTASQ